MADPTDIYNWLRLDGRITTSGQPTEAQLAALAALGVRTVINLAPHEGRFALPGEAEKVQALGMEYLNIPVDFAAPEEADFTAFAAAMRRLEGQAVHVHCAANYRVSAFLARYRRDVLGLPEAEARAHLAGIWSPNPVWAAFIDRRP
jgi:protein tyrosine phosphatase (PTP) superfamily phosphohydrolase (DUF442 family)